MALIRKTSTLAMVFAFAGALLGGVLAEALRHFSTEGMLRNVFLKGYGIGLEPPFTLDLHLISFTLGFMVEVNLFVLIGALTGFFLFKQI
jgi:predicted membrane protein